MIKQRNESNVRRLSVLVAAGAMMVGALGLAACESYDNGTTKSKTTKTVDTPSSTTTTTTTHTKTVQPQ